MTPDITPYDLTEFEELIPLLMRCFPDFWTPRLAEGKYSFPYDLKLFAARLEGKIIGCIGVHEYRFLFDNAELSCGGVCDVAVDPEHRGKGYAVLLQEFFMEYCQHNFESTSLMPLYTGKPGVYLKRGWQICESDRRWEIKTEDFPLKEGFTFDHRQLSLSCLRGEKTPGSQEEEKAKRIMKIYLAGKNFNGKCIRTAKTWWELFADSKHIWRLEEDTYFLYREGVLLEAYSRAPDSRVSAFTPKHGGFEEENKLMVNLPRTASETDRKIALALENGSLVFPAPDIF